MKIHNNILKNALALLFVFCATLPVRALDVKADFITMSDGLANNTVRYVYQDSKGFIWFATINGLSRYDGHNFRTLMPRNDGRISLADRRVYSMREDKNGLLWIKMTQTS